MLSSANEHKLWTLNVPVIIELALGELHFALTGTLDSGFQSRLLQFGHSTGLCTLGIQLWPHMRQVMGLSILPP